MILETRRPSVKPPGRHRVFDIGSTTREPGRSTFASPITPATRSASQGCHHAIRRITTKGQPGKARGWPFEFESAQRWEDDPRMEPTPPKGREGIQNCRSVPRRALRRASFDALLRINRWIDFHCPRGTTREHGNELPCRASSRCPAPRRVWERASIPSTQPVTTAPTSVESIDGWVAKVEEIEPGGRLVSSYRRERRLKVVWESRTI